MPKEIFRRALFMILVICTGGCRTIEAPSSYDKEWRPPAVKSIKKATAPVRTPFAVKTVDPSSRLGLDELLDISLANNPSTRQAWESARAAYAAKTGAEALWYPTALLSVQGVNTKRDPNAKGPLAAMNQTAYSPSIELTYLVFDFGGRDSSVRQALYTLISSNYQFNRTIQDLVLGLSETYYGLYSAQSNINAQKANVNASRTALVSAQKRFKAGLVSKLDVYQAESTYYNNIYNLESAKGDLKTAEADLAKVLGLPGNTKCLIRIPKTKVPTAMSRDDVNILIEEALEARPDISAERATVRAKEEAVKAAFSDLLPSVNFGSSVTKNIYEYHNSAKGWGDDWTYSSFNVTATWTAFDGFNLISKLKQAQAQARFERAVLVQRELEVSHDVWVKFYTFRSAIRKYSASRAFLKSAQGSYDLALEGYNAGLKSILDLTNAESDLSDARTQNISSRKGLFNAYVELVHAVGMLYPGYDLET